MLVIICMVHIYIYAKMSEYVIHIHMMHVLIRSRCFKYQFASYTYLCIVEFEFYTLQLNLGLIDLIRQPMANSVNPMLPPVQDHNCPDVNDIYCGIQCNYLKLTIIVLKVITSL